MELAPLAQAMFNEGYNAVLWDSKSRRISYGPKEVEQVRRIVEYKRISHTHSEQILERLDTDKDLWLVEGTGHTKAFSSSPVEADLFRFFAVCLEIRRGTVCASADGDSSPKLSSQNGLSHQRMQIRQKQRNQKRQP
jgi:hypothetical protein